MVGRRVGWIVGGALLLACALILLLARRVQDLSEAYQKLQLLSTLPHPGTVVPTFRTATLTGNPVTVGESRDSTGRQVLFVFNTRCPYCRAIIPIWHAITDSVSRMSRPIDVLAISLDPVDSTMKYVKTYQLRYRVLTFPQHKLERLFRVTAVPQTVVLDWSGTVLYAKTGSLERADLDSVYVAIEGGGRK